VTKALAYFRTSSAVNVGGDSDVRQRSAIHTYAANHGVEVVGEFYDAAVSGADALEDRPGYRQMMERIAGNGVRLVIVEDASRFARSVVVQELGLRDMHRLGVRVVTAAGTDLTDDTDPERSMIRQLMGVISEAEKRRLVVKLKGARDRKTAKFGVRCGGAKGHKAEVPAMVFGAIRELVAMHPAASMLAISSELAEAGLTTRNGKPYSKQQIARFLDALELDRVDARTRAAKVA
jgi:DNA invertase Pin-like site-specific DNA recombinase